MTHEELKTMLAAAQEAENVGNYDESVRLASQVLEATDVHINTEAELHTKALFQLGAIERLRGNWAKALEFYTAGLEQSESRADRAGIGTALNNLGTVHKNRNEYDNALDYYAKALSIAEELGKLDAVASCLSNIGNLYLDLSDHPKAIEYTSKALSIAEEQGNKAAMASFLGNLGSTFSILSDFPKALEYDRKALSIAQELGNRALMATNLGNIGLVYSYLSDYSKALEYYKESLSIDEELGNKIGVARCLGNIGNVYMRLLDFPKALEYLERAKSISEELGNKVGLSKWLGNIGSVHLQLSEYPKAIEYYGKALKICEDLGYIEGVGIWMSGIGEAYARQQEFDRALEYYSRGLHLLKELAVKAHLGEVISGIGGLYANIEWHDHDPVKAEKYLLESVAVSEELGSKSYEAHKILANVYERQERWKDFAFHLKKYCELKEEVQNEEATKSALRMEQNRQIAEREKQLSAERAESSATQRVLHQVLPASVAERLVKGEKVADYFQNVSILFADIVGFTPIASRMPAKAVLAFLNYVFGEFDRMASACGCEKIKTIGDGYLAVAGAPDTCEDHAERIARLAIEMSNDIILPEEIRKTLPKGAQFSLRIGIHTGPCFGGIVGENRFVYDIYSDAVNLAARMESHGEPGKIHVSDEFCFHLQNRMDITGEDFGGIRFYEREEMEIKGKGMMRTYFLERDSSKTNNK